MRLTNKVAIITGAADGIGRATSLLFGREGARVVCADIADSGARATAAAIRTAGGEALATHVDVRSTEDIDEAVRAAERAFGRVDIMIANAGTVGGSAAARPMEELTDDQWLGIIDVNLNGVFRCFRAAIPALHRAGGGALCATASIAALSGVAGQAAYSASKGGVVSLVRSLAYQLAADGIRVNCVCPGGVTTNLVDDETRARLRQSQSNRGDPSLDAVHRSGDPDEVAQAHLFLVSDESSLVNGHALVTDAGSTIANQWLIPSA
jgi:NAD(P)-dependent dehydrogenase (short-subunit alcohol dehydrogenase family)